MPSLLDRARWNGSTLELNGVEFEAGMHEYAEWSQDRGRFLLLKPRGLVELYERFWRARPTPRRVLELGAWEGGSAAFWFEAFEPEKHVAVDLITRTDSERFSAYVGSRGLGDRLKTYWGVDQADRPRLREIVEQEFDGPIDVVIDDASHLYEPTKASFDELFPRVRPGGLYVIEDWQWSYTDFEPPAAWAGKAPVSRLVLELLETVGHAPSPVASLSVHHNFAAVERSS